MYKWKFQYVSQNYNHHSSIIYNCIITVIIKILKLYDNVYFFQVAEDKYLNIMKLWLSENNI